MAPLDPGDGPGTGGRRHRVDTVFITGCSSGIGLAAARLFASRGYTVIATARSLETLAKGGADAFYRGRFAQRLVQGVRAMGGIWTLEDLAAYRVVERDPVFATYRDLRIVSAPPPSSGGVWLATVLNILAGYDLDALDRATRTHVTLEAMRRAHRDRAQYLGDPAFTDVPLRLLTSPDYAAGLRASINLGQATPSDLLPGYVDAVRSEVGQ